ncbi:MAG: hypothetical protein HY455_00680 [Parcubacteria group bacterium]|nr:hypothetical protein [Parcubacteria group bacterium]
MKGYNATLFLIILFLIIGAWFIQVLGEILHVSISVPTETMITSFEECAKAGNPIMESYPRQCRAGGETFVENIGDELEKQDLVRIAAPRPNIIINSPLVVEGEARGFWFFEATFPLVLVDWDGKIIAESYAQADGEWMTEEFVPYKGTIVFEKPIFVGDFSKRGALILKKSNASGLPEHDDALEIPVRFE